MRLRISSESSHMCLISPHILIHAPLGMSLPNPQGENSPGHEATILLGAGVRCVWHGSHRWERTKLRLSGPSTSSMLLEQVTPSLPLVPQHGNVSTREELLSKPKCLTCFNYGLVSLLSGRIQWRRGWPFPFKLLVFFIIAKFRAEPRVLLLPPPHTGQAQCVLAAWDGRRGLPKLTCGLVIPRFIPEEAAFIHSKVLGINS